MYIEYLFFFGVLVVCFWLFPKITFVKHAGFSVLHTRLLLAFKMVSGLAGAYYFDRMLSVSDQVSYNVEGLAQYDLLLSNPVLFFTDFKNDIRHYGLGGIFDASYSFWAYLRFNLLYKFIAILDLITMGNFYLNSVLFSTLVFFGNIAFYRIYSDMYRHHRIKILFSCFLIPSLLLYTSCVHKDGLVFLCISMISFALYSFLKNEKMRTVKAFLALAIGILTIFLLRNYVLVALLPAMFTALLAKRLHCRRKMTFAVSYSLFGLLFFVSGHFNSSFNLPNAVIKRKADFAALVNGGTDLPMNELYPTLKGFMENLPQAINHSLLRPYLWEFPHFGIILTAIELFFYQIILIGFVFFRNKRETVANNFNLFGFAFFISMMLIIGYTIPNIGAIVRYRSIFWIFLVCPLWCNIKWPQYKGLKN
jgi:hypothetical protein